MSSIKKHESAYVDEYTVVGDGTKIWHFSHIDKGAQVGKDCTIGQNVYVGNGAKVGDGVKLQNNVSVFGGVELEDHVFCGPSVAFTNVLCPRSEFPASHFIKTLVKRGASIGAGAVVIAGNTVGEYALVAAGAVVTRDVPAYAVMMGNPARQTGWICRCGQMIGGDLTCTRCGARYHKEGKALVPEAGE